ncbi:MAG TPA: hypothetical protein VNA04_10995, partial [Thermoanaerobaculia bacterium]|nr:hypothetical protein [Thermoanaerobaculia bacterium]
GLGKDSRLPLRDTLTGRNGENASTTESAAVLDVCRKLNLIAATSTDENKVFLECIAQMLTK